MTPETGSDQALHVDAPPVGEELHLPGPSVIPMLNALGASVALVGLALGVPVILAGLALFFWTLQRWVRETRRDINALPDSHG